MASGWAVSSSNAQTGERMDDNVSECMMERGVGQLTSSSEGWNKRDRKSDSLISSRYSTRTAGEAHIQIGRMLAIASSAHTGGVSSAWSSSFREGTLATTLLGRTQPRP